MTGRGSAAARAAARFLDRRTPLQILAVGWLAFLIYAFPGFLSYDSGLQLREARAGVYSNIHAPAMAALWSLVEYVVAGPVGMLVLQSLAFLGGTYLLLQRVLAPRPAALAASLVLLAPPIATNLAVIWGTSQMAGYLVLGAACVWSERRAIRVVGLAMLAVAAAMSGEAYVIAFALIVPARPGFVWASGARPAVRYAIAVAAWLAVAATAQLANRSLTRDRQHGWHGTRALFDIAGTLRFTPGLSDAELRPTLAGTPVVPTEALQASARAVYKPARITDVVGSPQRFFDPPATAAERAAITGAWATLVVGHPVAYLRHRWQMFRQVLGLTERPRLTVYTAFVDAQDPPTASAELNHLTRSGRIQGPLRAAASWLGGTWLFRPYVYLLTLLALAPLYVREREIRAIAGSGLLSQVALFFTVTTPDFRASLWIAISTILVVVMLVARRARSRELRVHPNAE